MFGLTKRQILTLIILMSGTFVAILNQTILGPALPAIMRDMNVNASTVQWLTTGFTLVNAVMIPISAYLTDRFSVRSLFIVAMSVFTAGSLISGFTTSFYMLLAGRLVQAAAAGVLMPMVMTVLLLTFPLEKRGMAMGIFGVVIGFAPTIGPVISGVVVDYLNWNMVFFGVAVLSAIDVLCAILFLEKGTGEDPTVKGIDKISVIQSTLGFGSMLYGFSEIGNSGFSPLAGVAILVGAVTIVFFFRRQLRLERPMLHVEVLKNRKFLIGTIVTMAAQGATMANMVIMPIYVQSIMGQSAITAALVMLPGSIIMGIMGPIAGNLFDKHGPRALVITGLIALTGGTVLMTQLTIETSMVYVTIIMAVRLFGMSMINMPASTWGINALDNRLINHGNAVNNTLRQVAGSLGTAIVVSAYSLWTSLNVDAMGSVNAQIAGTNFSFGLQALLLGLALVISIVFVRDRKEDAAEADPTGERKRAIEEIMERDFPTIPETATVADAARIFAEKNVDGIPVIDKDGRPVGFVSDGDLMRALSPQRENSVLDFYVIADGGRRIDSDTERWIEQTMERPVTTVASMRLVGVDVHASEAELYRVLSETSMRRVPVLDGGKLCGIVNRSAMTVQALDRYLKRLERMHE